jgi:hypothetical protein
MSELVKCVCGGTAEIKVIDPMTVSVHCDSCDWGLNALQAATAGHKFISNTSHGGKTTQE